jgi:hypothetical protein
MLSQAAYGSKANTSASYLVTPLFQLIVLNKELKRRIGFLGIVQTLDFFFEKGLKKSVAVTECVLYIRSYLTKAKCK